nr:hypothetical protein [uncultured Brevundimonas sp.]
MTFVTLTDPKKSVPLSQVTGVEKIERERLRLTMQDGTHVETHAFLWEHVARYQFQQVIPASPGTFLITETEYEGYAPEYFEPVIGWAVHAAGGVQPLIHYGIPDDDNAHVLHPDGKVTNAGGGTFKSLEEYLDLLAQAKAERLAA